MQTAKAKLRYLRSSPTKARLVADLIRGKAVDEAQTILDFTPKAAAGPLLKLLRSAIANAGEQGMDIDRLTVDQIWVDGGPMLKRFMPRAMGRATRIRKRTSHVTIILAGEE